MTILFYFGLFASYAVTTFSTQKYGRSTRGAHGLFLYSFLTGLCSMAVFFCLAGFSLSFNARTALYAGLLTLLCLFAYLCQLSVYRYMGVAEVGVISTGGNLILSAVLGMLLFGERLSPVGILRICLMLATVLLLFWQQKRDAENTKKDEKTRSVHAFSLIGLLFCIGVTVVLSANTVLSKYIAEDAQVTDNNSLFFLANVGIAALSLVVLLVTERGSLKKTVCSFGEVPGGQYGIILLNTVASNLTSLLGVWILASGADVMLYVPLSGALQVLATEAVAVFILHERPKLLPVALTAIVMLLGFFG